MKTFEEEFLNLNKCDCVYDCDDGGIGYREKDIQEHCKDNQIIKDIVGDITFLRGITPECQIHNTVNREKERILKELRLDK